MAERVTLAKTSDIPLNEGRAYPHNGRMIAIFNDNGQFFAMDDFCPHQGASLAGGWIQDGCVACPWHAWRFRLSDGCWMDNTRIRTDVYPVTVVGEDIQIDLP